MNGLGKDILVVIDVEFCVRVSGAGSLEGDRDKVLAEDVVEDR